MSVNPQSMNSINNTEKNTFNIIPTLSQLGQTSGENIAPTFTQASGNIYAGELNISAFNFSGTATSTVNHAIASYTNPIFQPSSTAGTLTITNAYGINITPSAAPGPNGAITNLYSLFVVTPSGATNNYTAIFGYGNNALVGIGTQNPHQALSVNGGTSYAVTQVTTPTYSVLNTDNTLEVNFPGPVNLTLPAASPFNSGQTFVIKDASGSAQTNPITVNTLSGLIDGTSSQVINLNYGFLKVYSNGLNYFIIDALAPALPTITVVNVTGTSQALSVDTAYVTTNSAATTLTLPTTAAAGSLIIVTGAGAGLFTIAQNAGQQIRVGNSTTTLGPLGSLASTSQGDSIELICTVANTNFQALNVIGNLIGF